MKVICPVCGTSFVKKTKNHVFDKRRCFKIDYNRRLRKGSGPKVYPNFLCPKCGELTKLDFNPKKNAVKWNNFICPSCNYKNNFNY